MIELPQINDVVMVAHNYSTQTHKSVEVCHSNWTVSQRQRCISAVLYLCSSLMSRKKRQCSCTGDAMLLMCEMFIPSCYVYCTPAAMFYYTFFCFCFCFLLEFLSGSLIFLEKSDKVQLHFFTHQSISFLHQFCLTCSKLWFY